MFALAPPRRPSRPRLLSALLAFTFLTPLAWASGGLTERVTVPSRVLGEDRVLAVVTPASYGQGQRRYPVLYVTDAEAQLAHTRATVEFLARNGLMPEVLLVGILNTDRTRDLTPTPGTASERADFPSAGGGERFLDFLEKELIPAIDARYRALPVRLYAGHSFGGLLGVYALLTRPTLFRAVVAASPSLGWDGGLVLRAARALKATQPPFPAALFVTLGSREASPAVLEDYQGFARAIQAVPWPGFDWSWQVLAGEDHGSVVLPGYYASFRHMFSGWRLPLEMGQATPAQTLASVRAYYESLSWHWGYAIAPPEGTINLLGYLALQRGDLARALDYFRFNVDAHAESANAHDSLGEALEKNGELSAAADSYRRAVELGAQNADPLLPQLRAHLKRLDQRTGSSVPPGPGR